MANMKIVSLPDAKAKQAREEMLQGIRQAVTPLRRDVDQRRADVDNPMEGKTKMTKATADIRSLARVRLRADGIDPAQFAKG